MNRTPEQIAEDFRSLGLTPPDPEVIEYVQQNGSIAKPIALTAGASNGNAMQG